MTIIEKRKNTRSLRIVTDQNKLRLFWRNWELTDWDISLQLQFGSDVTKTLYLMLYAPFTWWWPTCPQYTQLHNAFNKSLRQEQLKNVLISPIVKDIELSVKMRDTHIRLEYIASDTILLDVGWHLYGYCDSLLSQSNSTQRTCYITTNIHHSYTYTNHPCLLDNGTVMENLLKLF